VEGKSANWPIVRRPIVSLRAKVCSETSSEVSSEVRRLGGRMWVGGQRLALARDCLRLVAARRYWHAKFQLPANEFEPELELKLELEFGLGVAFQSGTLNLQAEDCL